MLPVIAGFDWDAGNRVKCQKHGVSITDIERCSGVPLPSFPIPLIPGRKSVTRPSAHPKNDATYSWSSRYGDATLVRPISARYMHRKEVKHYEKEIAKAQER